MSVLVLRVGLRNVGFLTTQPLDLADSPRKLHHNKDDVTKDSFYEELEEVFD
jgi:hypothetical protein